jgi:hypothetical protein
MEMAKPNPQMQASLRAFGAARVIERHDRLEAMIGDHPFLMGERPTLADGISSASRDGSTSIRLPIPHAGQNSPLSAGASRPSPPSSMQRRSKVETSVRDRPLASGMFRSQM